MGYHHPEMMGLLRYFQMRPMRDIDYIDKTEDKSSTSVSSNCLPFGKAWSGYLRAITVYIQVKSNQVTSNTVVQNIALQINALEIKKLETQREGKLKNKNALRGHPKFWEGPRKRWSVVLRTPALTPGPGKTNTPNDGSEYTNIPARNVWGMREDQLIAWCAP